VVVVEVADDDVPDGALVGAPEDVGVGEAGASVQAARSRAATTPRTRSAVDELLLDPGTGTSLQPTASPPGGSAWVHAESSLRGW
jgi:hypothetical protein